jgi:hypothetical protein
VPDLALYGCRRQTAGQEPERLDPMIATTNFAFLGAHDPNLGKLSALAVFPGVQSLGKPAPTSVA